jgi:hypothetical protein
MDELAKALNRRSTLKPAKKAAPAEAGAPPKADPPAASSGPAKVNARCVKLGDC